MNLFRMGIGELRSKLRKSAEASGLTSDERKAILVEAFASNLAHYGNYDYVAETTVLRPVKDRPLYCLFYATRHPRGIEVFRDCQAEALREQSKTRAATKMKHAEAMSGQAEIFQSLHDMAPDDLIAFQKAEHAAAEGTLLLLSPERPNSIPYEKLWPQVLARHVVRKVDVNQIAAKLRAERRFSVSRLGEEQAHSPTSVSRSTRRRIVT